MKIKIGIPQIDSMLGDFQDQRKRLIELDKHFEKEGADLVVYPFSFWTPHREEGFCFGVTFYIDAFNMLCNLADTLRVPTVIPVPLPDSADKNRTLLFIQDGCLDHLDEEDSDYDKVETRLKRSKASGFSALRLEDKTIAFFQGFDDLYVALNKVTPFGNSNEGFSEKARGEKGRKGRARKADKLFDAAIFLPEIGFRSDFAPSACGAMYSHLGMGDVAKDLNTWIIGINGVGGYEEEIYTGSSFVLTPWGEAQEILPAFREAIQTVEIDFSAEGPLKKPASSPKCTPKSLIYPALCLGTKDFIEKDGYQGAALLLTGDLNSSVLAKLAVDALGPTRVHAVCAPLSCATQAEKTAAFKDAVSLAKELRISFEEVLPERLEKFSSTLEAAPKDFPGILGLRAYVAEVGVNKGYASLTASDKTAYCLGHDIDGWQNCVWSPFEDLYRSEVADIARDINSHKETFSKEILSRLNILKSSQLNLCKNFSKNWRVNFSYAKEIDQILHDIVDLDSPLALLDEKVSDYTLAQAVVKRLYDTVKFRRTLPPGPCVKMISTLKAMFSWAGVWYDRFAIDDADRENIRRTFEEGRALTLFDTVGEKDVVDTEDPLEVLEALMQKGAGLNRGMEGPSSLNVDVGVDGEFNIDKATDIIKSILGKEIAESDEVAEALGAVSDTLSSGALDFDQNDEDVYGNGFFSNN